MITRIFKGQAALECAGLALLRGGIVAYQDLAPEHANCVRVALPLADNASGYAQEVYGNGLYNLICRNDHCDVFRDDYLTYGSPLDRPWVTAPQS